MVLPNSASGAIFVLVPIAQKEVLDEIILPFMGMVRGGACGGRKLSGFLRVY